jgi:hypothetical protein
MRFSPDGPARMLTHGGSVAYARGAPTLWADYSLYHGGGAAFSEGAGCIIMAAKMPKWKS